MVVVVVVVVEGGGYLSLGGADASGRNGLVRDLDPIRQPVHALLEDGVGTHVRLCLPGRLQQITGHLRGGGDKKEKTIQCERTAEEEKLE